MIRLPFKNVADLVLQRVVSDVVRSKSCDKTPEANCGSFCFYLVYSNFGHYIFLSHFFLLSIIHKVINFSKPPEAHCNFQSTFWSFWGTVEQNIRHHRVAPDVYLHFTKKSKNFTNPNWFPKTYSLKKFNLNFKTAYTAQVVLKTKYI